MTTPRLPDETHIGYVNLKVTDLDRSLHFYERLLGLQVMFQEEDILLAARADGPVLAALTVLPKGRPKPANTTGLYHVAIRLPDRLALARVYKRLVDHGWPFQGFSDHKVSEALYLSDPDGNGLELYRDRPRETWPVVNGQIAMRTDPLDVNALYAEAAADPAPWTGIHPHTDIGHVHLYVRDLAEAEAFYHGVLGLDVTQRDYPGALFFAAGGYHHHVGANIWTGQGAPPPPDDAVGLRHFTLVVPNRTVIAAIEERARATGRLLRRDEKRLWAEDTSGNVVAVVPEPTLWD